MEKAKRYTILQLKRILRFLPTLLITCTVLVLALTFFASILLNREITSDRRKKVQVGVVGDTSNSYLEYGLFALKHMDSSKYSIDIIELTEDEAKARMNRGTLNAYIIIPDQFAELLEQGINTPITYVTCDGAAGITSIIMGEVAEEISGLITEAQTMINSVQRYGYLNDLSQTCQEDIVETLFYRVFDLLLNRTELFDISLSGTENGLSLIEYYVFALMMVYLLFFGISCCHIFVKKDMTMTKLLMSKGYGKWRQLFGEYITYFVYLFISFLIALFFLESIFYLIAPQLSDLIKFPELDFLEVLLSMIPVLVLISAIQFLVFELVSDVISGILLHIFLALVLGFVSGCFYSVSFLPEMLQNLGNILPVGVALRYLQRNYLGQSVIKELLLMSCYLVMVFIITVLVRHEKIKRG